MIRIKPPARMGSSSVGRPLALLPERPGAETPRRPGTFPATMRAAVSAEDGTRWPKKQPRIDPSDSAASWFPADYRSGTIPPRSGDPVEREEIGMKPLGRLV